MKQLQKMYEELQTSNSKLDKIAILQKYPENKKALFYIYHPQYVYGLTSDNLIKNSEIVDSVAPLSIIGLLDELRSRRITGHKAIAAANAFIASNSEYTELIYRIIDRNLKVGVGTTEINKVWPGLIPEFKVQLADVYITEQVALKSQKLNRKLKKTVINYSETWYASRKLDGLRCVTICDGNGEPTCWSRQGKEFLTLNKLKEAIHKLPLSDRMNMVFDGELCILDENGDEDFKAISKLYGKTDKIDGVKVPRQIEAPHYKIFDYLTIDEFNNRKGTRDFTGRYLDLLVLETHFDKTYMMIPSQVEIQSEDQLNKLAASAVDQGWEGLIIRKNVPYSAKRSKNMLKVKPFFDAEFVITRTENTTKKMLNKAGLMVPVKCLGTAYIMFKGNEVGVGSGWSDSQRVRYGAVPEALIGKEVTVRYTLETEDENGNPSLRFPRMKIVHENGRNV